VPAVLNLFVPAGSTLLAWLLVDERLVPVQVAASSWWSAPWRS
jgi:hypothetical protein